jgi:prepilin-type N-terminal cleavage/methylation domain-containing protein
MRERISSEAGFTLVELIVASVVFLVILGATLTTFDRFQVNARLAEQRNDASEEVRRAADLLARDLRNLADPTTEALSIERRTGTDLVFRSVDPAATGTDANRVGVRRVRYCLDAANSRIYRSTQTWTTLASPAVPATTACGESDAWTGTCVAASTCERKVVAQFVTNARPATARDLFIFDSATPESVTFIRINAYVDVNAASAKPAETQIESGVNLRNQNRRPIAQLDPPVRAGGNDFVLNASSSTDPEGALLTYQFLKTSGSGIEEPIGLPQGSSRLVATLASGDVVRVKVTDPGNLSSYSTSYTVSVS